MKNVLYGPLVSFLPFSSINSLIGAVNFGPYKLVELTSTRRGGIKENSGRYLYPPFAH